MLKSKTKNEIVILMMLFMAFFIVIMPVQAATQELAATSENLNFLGSQGQWAQYRASPLQELLLYSSTSNFNVVSKKLVNVKSKVKGVGAIGAVKINEISKPKSQYDGQCVAFVKAVSKTPNIGTSSWTKGRPVVTKKNGKPVFNNIPAGTIIATFNSKGKYYGHTAIFGDCTSTGINVWDQNYIYSKVVGRHSIPFTGSGVNNAYNYYVVNVPA
jgi:hypothetical protein